MSSIIGGRGGGGVYGWERISLRGPGGGVMVNWWEEARAGLLGEMGQACQLGLGSQMGVRQKGSMGSTLARRTDIWMVREEEPESRQLTTGE